jgi:hypothetical protein
MARNSLKKGAYAFYSWPQTKGGEPCTVFILDTCQQGYLVRLVSDLKIPGDRTIKAGRIHICGKDWLVPFENVPAQASLRRQSGRTRAGRAMESLL